MYPAIDSDNQVIHLLLVADHWIVRLGIKAMLESFTSRCQFLVSGTRTEKEAIDMVESTCFDIILVDYNLSGRNGVETIKNILAINSGAKIMGMSDYADLSIIESMIEAGASGYFFKNADAEELLYGIKSVLCGNIFYPNRMAEKNKLHLERFDIACANPYALTKRELEILKMITMELTNEQISKKLFIGKRTVDKHRQNLLDKLHVKNTVGLVKTAYKLNLLN
jgi:DNA-binding NarL/FixJ family response regulator